jgi:hypothetical protein
VPHLPAHRHVHLARQKSERRERVAERVGRHPRPRNPPTHSPAGVVAPTFEPRACASSAASAPPRRCAARAGTSRTDRSGRATPLGARASGARPTSRYTRRKGVA